MGDAMLTVETWWGETWIAERGAQLPAVVRGGTERAWRVALLGVDLGRVSERTAQVLSWIPLFVDVSSEPANLAEIGLERELATIDARGFVRIAPVPGWRCPAGDRFFLREGECATLVGPGVVVRLRHEADVVPAPVRFVVAEARRAA
jgi:hypothetical protein